MTEPRSIVPPIKPDTSEQVSTVRYAAFVMAAIALLGLVVWFASSGHDTRSESAAAIKRDSDLQRSLFREENGRIYVSVPAAGQPALETPVAPAIVAALSRPARKPSRLPADEPTPASPAEPPPAATMMDAPHEPTTVEPARVEPTPDEPKAAQQLRDEEPAIDVPPPAEQMTDTTDEPPAESMLDGPTWDDQTMDEPDDEDEPMTDESDEQSDSDD